MNGILQPSSQATTSASSKTKSNQWIAIATIVILAALPFVLSEVQLNHAIKMMVAGLFALAFNLLWSHLRLLSFGHAAYYATGAFAVIHLMVLSEQGVLVVPTPLIPIAGFIASGLLGLLVGYFATIRTGTYFAMITLAVAEVMYSVAPKWHSLFGGESGISSMRMPWAGIAFGSYAEVYLVVLFWFLIGVFLIRHFSSTPLGRLAMAIGDNETRVQFLGNRTRMIKTIVFALSASISGLAGGLIAFTMESASFELYAAGNSTAPVINAFLGGADVFVGPLVGGAVMTMLGQLVSDATRLWVLYLGLIFVSVVIFVPSGIAGFIRDLVNTRTEVLAKKLARGLVVAFSTVVLVIAAVFAMEIGYRLIGTSPLLRISPDGFATVFGLAVEARSVSVWLLIAAGLCLACAGFYISKRMAKCTLVSAWKGNTHG